MNLPRLPYSAFDNPAANGVSGLVASAGNAARAAFCAAYRSNPNGWGPPPGSAFGLIALPMNELARAICPALNPPPTLPPPFSGGQCSVDYRVQASYRSQTGPANGVLNRVLRGPITGYVRTVTPSGAPAMGIGFSGGISLWVEDNPPGTHSFSGLSVSRIDGQPDNCGNNDNQRFPETPNAPAPTYTLPPVDVAPPGVGGPPWRFPVRVRPTLPRLPGISIQPEINIEVGPFNFNFGPFNWNWNINPPGGAPSWPVFTPPAGDGSPPIPPQLPPECPPCPPVVCPPVDYDRIEGDIEDRYILLRDRLSGMLACSGWVEAFTGVTIGVGVSGAAQLPPRTLAVRYIAQGGFPENANRIIRAPGGGQDVRVSCGWCYFSGGSFNLERQPLTWDAGFLPMPNLPRGAAPTRFSWVSTVGVEYIIEALVQNAPPSLYPAKPCQP